MKKIFILTTLVAFTILVGNIANADYVGSIQDSFDIPYGGDSGDTGFGGGGGGVIPVDGICSTTYQSKNIFNPPNQNNLCDQGTRSNFKYSDTTDSWTWTCDGIGGGQTIQCEAFRIYEPIEGTHTPTDTTITWRWNHNPKNPTPNQAPKKYEWSSNSNGSGASCNIQPNQNPLPLSEAQTGLSPNTKYVSYIVAYDDLCDSKVIKITEKTNKDSEDIGSPGQDIPAIERPDRQCTPNLLARANKCTFPNLQVNFIDISNNFAQNYINNLGRAGIVQGYYDSDLFKPDNTISRAEYLKVILRAFCIDYSSETTYNLPYLDVDKEAWEAKVIKKSMTMQAISPDNPYFRPHDPISRSEALKILYNVSGVEVGSIINTSFIDVNLNSWEAKYIDTANNMCIVDGLSQNGDMVFKPYDNLTRTEVSKIVSNALMLGKSY